jgi:hypothetical protein
MSKLLVTAFLFHRRLIIPLGLLVLSTGASCFNGTTEGTEDPKALCPSNEEPQVAPSAVTEADIYLDASESMQGYISAPGYAMSISPLQQLLQTSLLEKLSDAGLSPRLHTFGEEVNPTPLPLRELREYVRDRSKYSEDRSDVVAALERAGESTTSLSVIITDNAQDLEYAKEGRDQRAPGFDRSAIVRTVSQNLAAKGFGVWLLGSQSPFEGTYFSLQLTLNSTGVGTNRRVELAGGKERPFYCWIVSRDWEKGRSLVAELYEELAQLSDLGADGVMKVHAIEFFPGIVPDLFLDEPDENELSTPIATGRQGTGESLADVFRVRSWTSDPARQGVTSGELVFEQPRTSKLIFLLKARLTLPSSDRNSALLSLPLSAWEILPKESLDLGASLTSEVQHFVPSQHEGSKGSLSRYWELAVPYERLVSQPQNRWILAVPLSLRTGQVPGNYWLREWSTADDTTPEAIAGRTLYLYDVSRAILERTTGRQQQRGCVALRLIKSN